MTTITPRYYQKEGAGSKCPPGPPQSDGVVLSREGIPSPRPQSTTASAPLLEGRSIGKIDRTKVLANVLYGFAILAAIIAFLAVIGGGIALMAKAPILIPAIVALTPLAISIGLFIASRVAEKPAKT